MNALFAIMLILAIAVIGDIVDDIAQHYGFPKYRGEVIYLYMVIGVLLAVAGISVLG